MNEEIEVSYTSYITLLKKKVLKYLWLIYILFTFVFFIGFYVLTALNFYPELINHSKYYLVIQIVLLIMFLFFIYWFIKIKQKQDQFSKNVVDFFCLLSKILFFSVAIFLLAPIFLDLIFNIFHVPTIPEGYNKMKGALPPLSSKIFILIEGFALFFIVTTAEWNKDYKQDIIAPSLHTMILVLLFFILLSALSININILQANGSGLPPTPKENDNGVLSIVIAALTLVVATSILVPQFVLKNKIREEIDEMVPNMVAKQIDEKIKDLRIEYASVDAHMSRMNSHFLLEKNRYFWSLGWAFRSLKRYITTKNLKYEELLKYVNDTAEKIMVGLYELLEKGIKSHCNNSFNSDRIDNKCTPKLKNIFTNIIKNEILNIENGKSEDPTMVVRILRDAIALEFIIDHDQTINEEFKYRLREEVLKKVGVLFHYTIYIIINHEKWHIKTYNLKTEICRDFKMLNLSNKSDHKEKLEREFESRVEKLLDAIEHNTRKNNKVQKEFFSCIIDQKVRGHRTIFDIRK